MGCCVRPSQQNFSCLILQILSLRCSHVISIDKEPHIGCCDLPVSIPRAVRAALRFVPISTHFSTHAPPPSVNQHLFWHWHHRISMCILSVTGAHQVGILVSFQGKGTWGAEGSVKSLWSQVTPESNCGHS